MELCRDNTVPLVRVSELAAAETMATDNSGESLTAVTRL